MILIKRNRHKKIIDNELAEIQHEQENWMPCSLFTDEEIEEIKRIDDQREQFKKDFDSWYSKFKERKL